MPLVEQWKGRRSFALDMHDSAICFFSCNLAFVNTST